VCALDMVVVVGAPLLLDCFRVLCKSNRLSEDQDEALAFLVGVFFIFIMWIAFLIGILLDLLVSKFVSNVVLTLLVVVILAVVMLVGILSIIGKVEEKKEKEKKEKLLRKINELLESK